MVKQKEKYGIGEQVMRKRKGACILLCLLFAASLFSFKAMAKEEKERGQILYYNFEDADSIVVKDASGNGNDAIIRNYKKSGFQINMEVIRGVRVQALDLPGGKEGAYLELPDDILDGETQITICAWVKRHSNSGYQRIWDFGNDRNSYFYLLTNGGNEGFKGYSTAITDGGWTSEQGVSKGTDFEKNQWVFTAVTIRENEITLYEDGKMIGRTKADMTLSELGGTKHNYFGKSQFDDPHMDGELAEISMYNYAMEETEVRKLYEGLEEDQLLPESVDTDPDRLLYSYRQNYGADTKGARALQGMENPASLLKGTALGTYLSQLAQAYQDTGNDEAKKKAEYVVKELAELQRMSEKLGWGKGYLSAVKPEAFEIFETGAGYPEAGNPYGGIGSLLNGLLDVSEMTGTQEAYSVAVSLAEWTWKRSREYTEKTRELFWSQETTGDTWNLGGAMARLYGMSGKKKYERAAYQFLSPEWYQAMKEEKDGLNLLSAASGISQAQTLLEIYLANPQATEARKAAEYFWDTVTSKYAYATGSPGVEGRFRSLSQAVERSPSQTRENQRLCLRMLQLTWTLHRANPRETKYLDYYERILSNQNLEEIWELAAPASRTFERENGKLYVNLYISENKTFEDGLRIRMDAQNYGEKIRLSLEAAGTDGKADLYLRIPAWSQENIRVLLNGKQAEGKKESGFLLLNGVKAGDVIEVNLPFSCYLEENEEGEAAVMFGPYVMINEDAGREQTLVLTKKVTDSVERAANTMPSLMINDRKFLPYATSVYSDRKIYYHILYAQNPDQQFYRIRVENEDGVGGSVDTDSELVLEGEDVHITVKAKEGYELESLTVNGSKIDMGEEQTYCVKNVRENLVIAGSFVQKNPLTPNSDSLEQAAQVSAHYTAPWENLEGVKDTDFQPNSSDEGMGKGWGNWQQKEGAKCWIAYTWAKQVTLNACEIYWYDDGGDTGVPGSFYLEYLDENGQWKKAVMKTEWKDAIKKDQYNQILLEPVTTTELRLVMTVAEGKYAVGIYRWKVSEQKES